MRFTWVCALLSAAACSDFELPSALSREQLLAVRATPAAIPAGERGRLDALVGGPAGPLRDVPIAWSVEAGSGVSIDVDEAGDAWLAVAASAQPGTAVLWLRATAPSGVELLAEKRVTVGAERRDNPVFARLEAAGRSILDGELRVRTGDAVELRAELDDAAHPLVSWYATVGDIELYRRNPTELVVPDQPSGGWLIAVGRDGDGGVTWMDVRITVE